jgi:hypothetical protein
MRSESILGNKYGHWTITDDSGKRKSKKTGSYRVVTAQCDCGTIKIMPRSPFMHGVNSEKCFKCYHKVKRIPALAHRYVEY